MEAQNQMDTEKLCGFRQRETVECAWFSTYSAETPHRMPPAGRKEEEIAWLKHRRQGSRLHVGSECLRHSAFSVKDVEARRIGHESCSAVVLLVAAVFLLVATKRTHRTGCIAVRRRKPNLFASNNLH